MVNDCRSREPADLAAVESLGAIDASLNAVRAAQMSYVTAEEAEDETGLKTVLDEATAGIDEESAHYEHTIVDAENRRRFDAAKKEVARYLERTAPFFALAEADRHDAALEVLNSQNQEYQDARATLGDYLAFNAAVEQMVDQISEIATAAQQISGETRQMESSIGEVAAVAEQSSASAEQVSASTEQTSASTEEIAASAQELARTAERLQELVGRFQLV